MSFSLRGLVTLRYQAKSFCRQFGSWDRRSFSSFPSSFFPCLQQHFQNSVFGDFRKLSQLAHEPPRKGCTNSRLLVTAAAGGTSAQDVTDHEKSFKNSEGTSVDEKELEKFAETAALWWNKTSGPYAMLHSMNPVRCSFIRNTICQHFSRDPEDPKPLSGLSLLDVGCGGGLLCEPLARMGGDVTGVDAANKSIAVAATHAAQDPATADIRYLTSTAEKLVEEGAQFDVVLSLEVIEHVKEPLQFVRALSGLCRPKGLCIISTINRTPRSYGLAIVAAERVLGWVPRGTHDFHKFLTPEELTLALHRANLEVAEMAGMLYTPFSLPSWKLAEDVGVNYIVSARKV